MNDKATLLGAITQALKDGILTEDDVRSVLSSSPKPASVQNTAKSTSSRASAVDIMFYITGIVLFAGIAVLIGQSWDSGPIMRIFLSVGVGSLAWAYAASLVRSKNIDDIRKGLTNALLLCGSLLLISGGFIVAGELVSFEKYHFFVSALVLLALGALHMSFGLHLRRKLLLLIGILLAVAAFPSTVFGLFEDSNVPMYTYALITAISGGLLAYAARVTGRISTSHKDIMRSFDSFGAFVALMSLYAASYDDSTGVLWLLVLIAGIVGLFYLSIVMQDKYMLGNGSFFLVLSIITISFRYFSGYGAAFSLLISAVGLLATAVVATNINRRYLKASA